MIALRDVCVDLSSFVGKKQKRAEESNHKTEGERGKGKVKRRSSIDWLLSVERWNERGEKMREGRVGK